MHVEHEFDDNLFIILEGSEHHVLNALRILRDAYISGKFNSNRLTKLVEVE